jgi:acyl CoA:acetate/3-ketoacid CoA transferase alpha subunit
VLTVRRKSSGVGLELVPTILFVGDAVHTGGGGRGRGSRCSEVHGEEYAVTEWWRGPVTAAAALLIAGCAPLL